MEPSYGVFEPVGMRDRVTHRLLAKVATFESLEKGATPRLAARVIQRYQPAVGGSAKCAVPPPATLPKVDVVYDDDSVFAWYK